MANATGDYHRGEMNVAEQRRTFSGFMKATVWFCAHLIILILGLSLVFAVGTAWPVAIAISAAVGVAIGFFLNLGAGWHASVIGAAILAGGVGVVFSIANAFIG